MTVAGSRLLESPSKVVITDTKDICKLMGCSVMSSLDYSFYQRHHDADCADTVGDGSVSMSCRKR